MKKLFIIALSVMLFSCTKENIQPSVTQSISSDAKIESFTVVFPLDQRIENPCTGEELDVSGQFIVKGTTSIVKGQLRFKGSIQYKNAIGIGINTGTVYHLKVHQSESSNIDIAADNPMGQFTVRSKASIRSSTSTFITEYTYRYTADLTTGEATFKTANFLTYCK